MFFNAKQQLFWPNKEDTGFTHLDSRPHAFTQFFISFIKKVCEKNCFNVEFIYFFHMFNFNSIQ